MDRKPIYYIKVATTEGYNDQLFSVYGDHNITTHFKAKEIASPDQRIGVVDVRMLSALEDLRTKWGKPLPVNSMCRTVDHNSKVGGHYRSLHLMHNKHHPTIGTIAVDIDFSGSVGDIDKFATLAYSAGWSVGVGRTYVHIDYRSLISLPQTKWEY